MLLLHWTTYGVVMCGLTHNLWVDLPFRQIWVNFLERDLFLFSDMDTITIQANVGGLSAGGWLI